MNVTASIRRCLMTLVTVSLALGPGHLAFADEGWHPPLIWHEPGSEPDRAGEGVITPVTSDREKAAILERLEAFQSRSSSTASGASVVRTKAASGRLSAPGRRNQAGPIPLWIGESRGDLTRRLGPPTSHQGTLVETRGGLVTWFDGSRGKLMRYRNEDPRFASNQGVRPGMDLEAVLRVLVTADGVYVASEPTRTEPGILLVQAMDEGIRVEMLLEGRRWISRVVWGDTPTGTLRAGSSASSEQPLRRLDARVITRILAGQPELPLSRAD